MGRIILLRQLIYPMVDAIISLLRTPGGFNVTGQSGQTPILQMLLSARLDLSPPEPQFIATTCRDHYDVLTYKNHTIANMVGGQLSASTGRKLSLRIRITRERQDIKCGINLVNLNSQCLLPHSVHRHHPALQGQLNCLIERRPPTFALSLH